MNFIILQVLYYGTTLKVCPNTITPYAFVNSCLFLCSVQVRGKLVEDWLPVLVVYKDNGSATPISPSNKSLYLELEETFLRIISTLPMSDA